MKITKETIKQIIDYQESKNDRSKVEDIEGLLCVLNETVSWLISRYIMGRYKLGIEEVTPETVEDIIDNLIYLLVHDLGTTDAGIIYEALENEDQAIQHLWRVVLKEEVKDKNDFDILKTLQTEILTAIDYYYNDNYLNYEEHCERIIYIATVFYKVIISSYVKP